MIHYTTLQVCSLHTKLKEVRKPGACVGRLHPAEVLILPVCFARPPGQPCNRSGFENIRNTLHFILTTSLGGDPGTNKILLIIAKSSIAMDLAAACFVHRERGSLYFGIGENWFIEFYNPDREYIHQPICTQRATGSRRPRSRWGPKAGPEIINTCTGRQGQMCLSKEEARNMRNNYPRVPLSLRRGLG